MRHVSPVGAQTYPGNEEADDVDDDEDSNNEIKVEELSRLEEAVHSSIFSAYETLECPHVGSGDVTRPSLIQESRYNCQQGRQALSVQCVAQDSFYRRLLIPKFEHMYNNKTKYFRL